MSKEKGARSRRFEGGLAPDAVEVNESVSFDYRLLPHDVAGSVAHAKMLARQGIIPSEDAIKIEAGLAEVEKELTEGKLAWDPKLEDVHMNVEAHLSERIGDAGRRLHTGRSRNDQVATDMRLYARAHALKLANLVDSLRNALVTLAAKHVDDFLPGYTHLQRAQPVRLAHHLMAYNEMLRRDRGRLLDARKRAGECPLGSGALAATTFNLDRESVAKELGFDGVTHNSLDAVADRDFVVELVAAIALCQVHLSRLGEELVLWLSQEFRFATLGQSYCSGSSIMPQKVNPDLAELIRGKSGRVIGDWVTLVTVLKGLPMAYNKDLQETQEPMFDAVETLDGGLRVAIGMIENLQFNTEVTRAAVDTGFLVATEVADYLVSKGLPFRKAHDIAGALVRTAIEQKCELGGLALSTYQEESDLFEADVFEWLDIARAVDRRNIIGGPAKERILDEIERAYADLQSAPEDSA